MKEDLRDAYEICTRNGLSEEGTIKSVVEYFKSHPDDWERTKSEFGNFLEHPIDFF
jgi:hypothetical protein